MNKFQIIAEMQKMGYSFNIEYEAKSDSKKIEVTSRTALNKWETPTRYAKEYLDIEIIKLVIYDVMRWAGLHIEQRLTYKKELA